MTKGKLYNSIVVYEDDGLIEEVHSILSVLDEAKKDYPHLFTIVYDDAKYPQWDKYVSECQAWYRKWFGDEE